MQSETTEQQRVADLAKTDWEKEVWMSQPRLIIQPGSSELLRLNGDGTVECKGIDDASEAAKVFIDGIAKNWKIVTSGIAEQAERETVEKIVAWLRSDAPDYPLRLDNLAYDIEAGEWKR